MGLAIETRALTPAEREILERRPLRPRPTIGVVPIVLVSASMWFSFVVLWNGVLDLGFGLLRIAGTIASLATVVAAYLVWLRREPDRDRRHPDLIEGAVTVLRAAPVAAVRDDELAFFLDSGDGRILYLSGPYLGDAVRAGRFPCRSFELVRAASTHEPLTLSCTGEPLPAPDLALPELLDTSVHLHLVDGAVFEGTAATLPRALADWIGTTAKE